MARHIDTRRRFVSATHSSLGGRAAAGAKWTGVSAVFTTVLQLGTLVVLTRYVSPSAFGVIAVVLVVQSVGQLIAEFGLSAALIQRQQVSDEARDSLYWLNVGLGMAVCVAAAFASIPLSILMEMPALRVAIPVASIVFAVSGVASQYIALAQKSLRFRLMAAIESTAAAGMALASVLLAMSGLEVGALLGGIIVNAVTRSALWMAFGVRAYGRARFRFSWAAAKPLVRFGAFRFGGMLANILGSRADQLIVGAAFGPHALGLYSVAGRVSLQPVEKLNPIIGRVAFPVMARIQDDLARIRSGYLWMLRVLSMATAPLLIGIIATADLLIPYLLGSQWREAISLVQLLAICALLRAPLNAGGSVILALGRADWSLYWNLAVLGTVPPVLILAASHSLETVVLTLAAVQALLVIVYHRVFVRRLLRIRLSRFLWSFLKPVVAAVLSAVVSRTIVDQSCTDDFGCVASAVGIYIGAYLVFGGWLLRADLRAAVAMMRSSGAGV